MNNKLARKSPLPFPATFCSPARSLERPLSFTAALLFFLQNTSVKKSPIQAPYGHWIGAKL